MSINNVGGILWSEISKIMEVNKNSVVRIMNNSTESEGCVELNLSYGRDGQTACGGVLSVYYLDTSLSTPTSLGVLYMVCNDKVALEGYYSDGIDYWSWNGFDFTYIGRCKKDR